MMKVSRYVFNPLMENTYIISDETGACIIIDPGCSNALEHQVLADYIQDNDLKPVRLINTHCHVDHVPGNSFVAERYGLILEIHALELPILKEAPHFAEFFGLQCPPSPEPGNFLIEGDLITFGNSYLKVLFTPGHSPGHLSFYSAEDGFVVSGDVLFRGSIGRFDLPGADGKTLLHSIIDKLFHLPDHTVVYSGHGPETTIGHEKKHNPYLQARA